jgi:hypothetical protein
MNTVEGIGYLAASLVLATFCMKSMDALRLAAIASNLAFIAYGYFGHLAPVLLLHALLLPINIYRLVEPFRRMVRNVRKGPVTAVERSAARWGIVQSALEPVRSTDRLWLKWARTGAMHCSANQQIMDSSFGWRIEEIVREQQHQPRHNRAADHQWRLVSSSCQPGPQIFHPQTNYKVQYGGTCL